ncbi:MAG: MMPL family transporter [Pseudomonadales bacterium]|nr:MMPL family transporter [Pseudomonadales bacterium]
MFVDRLVQGLLRFRTPLLFCSLFLVVMAGIKLPELAVDGNPEAMFDDDNPQFLKSNALQDEYIQSEKLMIFIKVPDGNVFTTDVLSMLQEFTEESWRMPYSIRVDSLSNYQRTFGQEDTFIVDYLVPQDEILTAERLSEIRSFALQDDILSQVFVSKKGDVASIIVTLAMPDDNVEPVREITAFAEKMREDMVSKNPGLEVHFSGELTLLNNMQNVALDDLKRLLPVVFGVIFIILAILLRSLAAMLASMILIACTNTIAIGTFVAIGGELNPVSMSAPMMILVLAVADSIHLMTQFIIQLQNGQSKIRAMEESMKKNMLPIFLTSITTAIGFLGMHFSDSPAFRDMGTIAAFGVMVAFVLTNTMLPAIVLMLPTSPRTKPLALTPYMVSLSEFTIKRHKPIFWVTLLFISSTVIWIPKIEMNDSINNYFDDSLEFAKALKFANDNMSSFQFILYSLDSGKEGYANDPEFLAKVERFNAWLKQQPEITNVTSYLNIVKSINQSMHGEDPQWHKVPETRQLASQYMLLYEMSLGAGQDLTQDINLDRSAIRVMVSLKEITAVNLIELEERIANWFDQEEPSIKTEGGSQALMFAHLGMYLIKSMVGGSVFSLLLITAVLMVGIGSFRFGCLSIIPNLFPAAIVYGCWAITVGEVDQSAAMTFSISLGMVVDDTVHFLTKYLGRRKAGDTAEDAIRYTYRTAGTALVVTTLTLSSGLILLVLSHFRPNDTVGIMLSSIIVVALALDLFFLPALLIRIDKYLPIKVTKEKVDDAPEGSIAAT